VSRQKLQFQHRPHPREPWFSHPEKHVLVYSDNYLANIVLGESDAGNETEERIEANITSTMNRYLADSPPPVNQYLALGTMSTPFDYSHDYALTTLKGATIKITLNNWFGGMNWLKFADVAFLEATAFYNRGDYSLARQSWSKGQAMWDGKGFNDLAFEFSPSGQQYQTYKLALYVYSSLLLNETFNEDALNQLLAMQAKSGFRTGCFFTGYSPDMQINSDVNTETTSLAVLALDLASYGTTPAPSPVRVSSPVWPDPSDLPFWVSFAVAILLVAGFASYSLIKRVRR